MIPKSLDCLPFPCYTRTILRPTIRHSRPQSEIRSWTLNAAFSTSPFAPRFENWYSDDIPFEEDLPPITGSNFFTDFIKEDAQIPNSRQSTLTTSEKAIFERILEDGSKKPGQASIEGDLDEDPIASGDPYEDLNAIFDLAIQKLNIREERRAESIVRDRANHAVLPVKKALEEMGVNAKPNNLTLSIDGEIHKGFSRPLQFVDGKLTQPPIGDVEESDERLHTACDEHRTLIRDMLENTSTDVEIWKILQAEVFSMVKQLRIQMDHEEKLGRSRKSKPEKDLKETSKAKARAKQKDPKAPAPDTNSEVEHMRPSASSQIFSPLFNESKALTTNALLAILQANYSNYNVLALRLWRRRHPTTPYALHLLPQLKSLGSISYVLGASASLYNEVLFVKWSQYNDLHGIADLLQEMVNQGVGPNDLTLEFLHYISRTRRRDMAGRRGKVLQSWWYLRGTKEGWAKVQSIYKELRGKDDATEAGDMGTLVGKIQTAMDEDEQMAIEETGARIQKVLTNPMMKEKAQERGLVTGNGFRRMRYRPQG